MQRSVPSKKGISQIESAMIEKEVEVVLSKRVITSVNQEEDHFLSTLFLLPKKGWESETSNKFEAFESVHTLPTFPNGRFELPKGFTKR